MPTQNRRVATYLPKELDDRLKAFIAEHDLKGDSPALIAILSEYFGVSQQIAQKVDYSSFVTQEQFNELVFKVSEVASVTERSNSLSNIIGKLSDKLMRLEERIEALEVIKDSTSTLSTGELAKRLGIDASTLSHWKSTGKKGKSPDELLKATREKDPHGIGWILIPETGKFRPERDLPDSSSSVLQGDLLTESHTSDDLGRLPEDF